MKFSLIIATLNRHFEIFNCLESLINQFFTDFEIIIIDQSKDDLTQNVVESIDCMNIKYYKVDFTGLSKARNYGLKYALGEYICLLDDDAVYKEDYLENASNLLGNKMILSGAIFSIDDRVTPFVKYSKCVGKEKLSINSVVNSCPSAALIFPIELYKIGCLFNETLGVGNDYASGEETDFLLTAIDMGYYVCHSNCVIAYHPIKSFDTSNLMQVYKHAMGKGALFKIDFKYRKHGRLLMMAAKNTLGMFLKAYFLDKGRRSFYLARFKGFIQGYKNYQSKEYQ